MATAKPTLSPTLSMVGNTLNLQTQYQYVLALGVLGAFGFGFGTGANDVANAFGTRCVHRHQFSFWLIHKTYDSFV